MMIFSSSVIWIQSDLINLLPSSCNVILTSKWFYHRCRFNNIPPTSLQSAYWFTELRSYTTVIVFISVSSLSSTAFDRAQSRHLGGTGTMKLCHLKCWFIPAVGWTGHEKGASLGRSLTLAAVLPRLSSRRDVSAASHTTIFLSSQPSWSTVPATADSRRGLKETTSFVSI